MVWHFAQRPALAASGQDVDQAWEQDSAEALKTAKKRGDSHLPVLGALPRVGCTSKIPRSGAVLGRFEILQRFYFSLRARFGLIAISWANPDMKVNGRIIASRPRHNIVTAKILSGSLIPGTNPVMAI